MDNSDFIPLGTPNSGGLETCLADQHETEIRSFLLVGINHLATLFSNLCELNEKTNEFSRLLRNKYSHK